MPNTTTAELSIDLDSLPSPPHVAIKVTELCDDPDTGISELCEVLSLDSALCASILRIANSTAYSRGRTFGSITQAVSVLGTKSTAAIALGFAIKESIPNWAHPKGLSDLVLWRHSVGTAVFARDLSRLISYEDQQQAFLCGLLSRLGQLVLYKLLPEQYGAVLDESTSILPDPDLERTHCGSAQSDVGQLLLQQWKLPKEIYETVGKWPTICTGEPVDPQDPIDAVAAVVLVADHMSMLITEKDDSHLDRARNVALKSLGVSAGEVDRLFTSCEQQYQETLAIFGDTQKPVDCAEILASAQRSLAMMSLRLAEDLANANRNAQSLEEENRSLEISARTDALTGLPNRAALQLESDEVWQALEIGRRSFSVLMLDVDHFKSFNDTYGHQAGDAVLAAVAESLKQAARGTDFVARYGGEEFTVILTNATSEHTRNVAERFRAAIESMVVKHEDETFKVTVSVGYACSDQEQNATCFDDIIGIADKGLYIAKERGRNQVASPHQ